MFGAPPQNPNKFLALSISNTPILGIQKHVFWPMVCRGIGVWGATAEPKQYIFGVVHFKHTDFRYPQTGFLDHGVQRYGREGAWPLTPRTPIPEIRLTSCYPHQCHPALECPGKRSRDIYCAPECAIAYSQYCASNLLCKENTACPFHGSSSSLAFYAL